ncbi:MULTISPECIES: c-type cytochrome [Bacteria]|uniref:Cytochrome c domain-containing protein n=1 Tax=Merismopedia glauca CCAP 1448/3 TaxID=1296344 RepID=A0A2T1C649_9CYAN|nr:c-type cytochrome [Merismopedia glauca]PSB03607.1 hypothetical protein C7B64_07655 [Merismopedia glauca CCAP 1448/3]
MISSRLLAFLIASIISSSIQAGEAGTVNFLIKSIANSCSSCHGVNTLSDSVIPGIAGLDQRYFISKMTEYRQQNQPAELRVPHAKDVTEEEVVQLAAFFAQKSRACPYYQTHPAGKFAE